jgi:hypothetical protein
MMRRMTYEQYKLYMDSYANSYKQNSEMIKGHISKIKEHTGTKNIKYPEYKEAFDYVDSLFPHANVKDVDVFMCNRKFLDSLGYSGVGGFFERVMKTIVMPDSVIPSVSKKNDIVAKLTIDEVLVHELLHYSSDSLNKKIDSMEIEEEFAYGNSIRYLKGKGYTDDEIVNNNFMPHLFMTIDRNKVIKEVLIENGYNMKDFVIKPPKDQKKVINKYQKQIKEKIKQEAFAKGKKIIEIYSGTDKLDKETKIEDGSKIFDFIDF